MRSHFTDLYCLTLLSHYGDTQVILTDDSYHFVYQQPKKQGVGQRVYIRGKSVIFLPVSNNRFPAPPSIWYGRLYNGTVVQIRKVDTSNLGFNTLIQWLIEDLRVNLDGERGLYRVSQ